MSLFGKPNVEKLAADHNVKGLVKALDHKDRQVRKDAARALGELTNYFNVPPVDLNEKSKEWPLKWPGVFYEDMDKGWLHNPLKTDEIIIGNPLVVHLEFKRMEQTGAGVSVLAGSREEKIYTGMRYRTPQFMDTHHPAWNALALMITDHRLIIISVNWGIMAEPYWSCLLHDLHQARIQETSKLVLDFGDDDPLTFKVETGISDIFSMISKEQLPDWAEQVNRLLDVIHKGEPELNLYLSAVNAEKRGAFLAAEKLISKLQDEDAEVRAESARSLQKIREPRATTAIAK